MQEHATSQNRSRRRAAILIGVLAGIGAAGAGGALAGTRFVNAAAVPGGNGLAWSTAFRDLNDALDAAAASGGAIDQIWVAGGAYRPDRGTLARTAAFNLVAGVTLYGGFAGGEASLALRDPNANPSVLTGDLLANDGPGFANIADNAFHVVRAVGPGAPGVIDGFVITGGNASDLGGDNSTGGGVWIRNAAAVIRNCVLVRNRAGFGGAAHLNNASATIINCVFDRNVGTTAAGAIFAQPAGHIDSIDCTFIGNSATFQGGALALSQGSSLDAVNARFLGNTATGFGGGAVLNSASTATFANCVFSGNATSSTVNGGGAIRNERATATLINCTLARNHSPAGGGAVFNFLECTLAIRNSVLYQNTGSSSTEANQIVTGPTPPVIAHSILQGWSGVIAGFAVFDASPQFVDADGADNIAGTLDDNLRLAGCSSPAVNAGDDAALPADALDLDADADLGEVLPLDLGRGPRQIDGRVDLGAFEYALGSCPCGDVDRDGIATAADLSPLAACLGGPEIGWPVAGCAWPAFSAGDCDRDGDVDLADVASYQAAF